MNKGKIYSLNDEAKTIFYREEKRRRTRYSSPFCPRAFIDAHASSPRIKSVLPRI